MTYTLIEENGAPIKAWISGVPLEDEARKQLINLSQLPFIYKHIAVMPDVHWGLGATIGSVVATKKAIIPAAVGVDIGCGMCAYQTNLKAEDLPTDLKPIRNQIERDIPLGMNGFSDQSLPRVSKSNFTNLNVTYEEITEKHPKLRGKNHPVYQMGSLGGGNHFIELCLDENQQVWIMLHSGSRGVGNQIGRYFIEMAKTDMENHFEHLPDKNLAYITRNTEAFNDYWKALVWAQSYAYLNRQTMMAIICDALKRFFPQFQTIEEKAVNCHHNYCVIENHFGENVFITRKGAVSARENQMGIIPGSMGAKSFIVKGLGNPESFNSCSHGAGRIMSRTKAKERFTIADHELATQGVECRKDKEVLDETPGAYKDIANVMAAQADLVDIVHTLKQFLCVKG